MSRLGIVGQKNDGMKKRLLDISFDYKHKTQKFCYTHSDPFHFQALMVKLFAFQQYQMHIRLLKCRLHIQQFYGSHCLDLESSICG